ncbi:MAG: vWA domain-containing protein, partial [Treponemataceae bacterium]
MRTNKCSLPLFFFCFSLCVSATAYALPSDVFVVWDVSGSMRTSGVVPEVKSYLKKEVVQAILKPGDRFTLIAFGSEARTLLSRNIETDADKDAIAKEIEAVRTDDAYTDIGIALEKLDEALGSAKDGARRPIAVFITDGKNAPPKSSPYSGKNLSVDQRFKDVGRRIAMKGWNL